MPRRKTPAYECSFCGDELAGAWEFPTHRCEPMVQIEMVIARVVARFAQRAAAGGGPAAAANPENDPMYQAKKRAAELLVQFARQSGLHGVADFTWSDVARYQETFEQVWRAAKVAAHPDRGGSEELFHTVQQAAETLKRAFQSGQ